MAPDPQPTRRKLVDAAMRLFAERGVNAVSQAEIVRAAEQRNTAALVYHFKDRDGVLRAIVAENVDKLRARRLEMLALAVADSPTAVRPVVEALVRPIADLADGDWRDRAYLQIHADLTGHPVWSTAEVRELLQRGGALEVLRVLAQRCPPVPDDIREVRSLLVAAFVGRAAAARARAIAEGAPAQEFRMSHARFVANLVDVAVAAMTTPMSEETLSAGTAELPQPTG
jgi:AcrR family transcriptional regulator